MNEFLFTLRKWATALFLPPTGPLLVAALGLLLLHRRPRVGHLLAWAGVATLLALSLPIVAHWLTMAAAYTHPLDLARAREAQAIVVLGGGIRRNAREYGGDTLNALSLERVRYGARLAKQLALPVLVSGGAVWGRTAEADVLADALEREFGVTVQWRERRSRDTRQNALYSAELLRAAGVSRVVLVGHSFDLPRSSGEFALHGIEVIPAPTVLPSVTLDSPTDFLPNMGALTKSYFALYELLADAVRKVREAAGRFATISPTARVTSAPIRLT